MEVIKSGVETMRVAVSTPLFGIRKFTDTHLWES